MLVFPLPVFYSINRLVKNVREPQSNVTMTARKTSLKKCKRLDQILGKEKKKVIVLCSRPPQNVKISGFVSVSHINYIRYFLVVVVQ